MPLFNRVNLAHPMGYELQDVRVRADLLPYEISNIISPEAIVKKKSNEVPFSHPEAQKKVSQRN